MGKIFLSHSSKDKEYVGYIANLLGKDHCTYDEMCFEYGMKNIDEIFKEIDKTSIFVFFISDNSLKSDWVKDELDLAEEKLKDSSHKLSQIFPIIIDNTITYADSRIPDYLKKGIGSYNIRPISTPQVAYKKIITQQKDSLIMLVYQITIVFMDAIRKFLISRKNLIAEKILNVLLLLEYMVLEEDRILKLR